jgi:hypothetical protein
MLTLVWFLASMGPNMNSESTPLNEALATARSHTRVRPLIGVDTIMPLEVRLAVKALGYYISGPVNHIASKCFRYLVACLPVTLEGSRIRLVLYQFHDVHPAIPSFVKSDLPRLLVLSRISALRE